MITFLIGVAILILGYFTYGKFVERVFGPDDRKTPALANPDGVDRVPMPHWKNVLIQLLNIAGIGPVIGVILGIKFGAIVFILLPLGNVLGGAVHDYFSGMISMRNNGYNVPALSRKFLGKGPAKLVMTLISVALILVGAVFTTTPAALVNTPILVGSADTVLDRGRLHFCLLLRKYLLPDRQDYRSHLPDFRCSPDSRLPRYFRGHHPELERPR